MTMPLDQTAQQLREEARVERLQAFADALAKKRTAAVEARAQSGVEREWEEDEDYYNGVDELNREEFKALKGAAPDSPLTTRVPDTAPARSTVFLNITQTYVDMAAASVSDMLLPTDDMPFAVLPMPEPELHAALDDMSVITNQLGQQTTLSDAAKKMLAEAKDSADRAQTEIWDWLTEAPRGHGGGWHAEARKLINQAARIGTSVIKGPFPVRRRAKKINRDPKTGRVQVTMVESLSPTSKQINVQNFYPDPSCGENIHDGSYTWEKDKITARAIRDMKGMVDEDGKPMYLDDQLDKVLEEGPGKKYAQGGERDEKVAENETYEIWYFHGVATVEDLEAAGVTVPKGSVFPVMVTMINDHVIAATPPTLDSGDFPYDVLVWQRVPGQWTGRSEARKIRAPQRMLVAATRAMSDNAGLAAGPQIVIDEEVLYPADGKWQITPRKVWKKKMGQGAVDMTKAMHSVKIDSMQEDLLNIIKFSLEMADKCATMPIQQQGQQGVTQETAEGRRLLQNNASVQKRAMAKIFDDNITEPHVGRYYEYLLLWGKDDQAKREFVIDARGSTALFERDAQNMAVAQVGNLVKDPSFGIDPKKWIVEFFKSNKLDPQRFQYTEEEQKQIEDDQKKNPPQDPKVAIAAAVEQVKSAGDMKELQLKGAIAADQMQHKESENAKDRQNAMAIAQIEHEDKLMAFAHERGISLDEAKVELTKTAMELRTQKDLATQDTIAAANRDSAKAAQPTAGPPPRKGAPQGQRRGGVRPAPQVAPAAVEPPGRAPPGEAFQK